MSENGTKPVGHYAELVVAMLAVAGVCVGYGTLTNQVTALNETRAIIWKQIDRNTSILNELQVDNARLEERVKALEQSGK